jgi:hypothetical protein
MKKINVESEKLIKNFIGFSLFLMFILVAIEKSLAYFVSISSDSHTGKYNLVMGHKIDPEIVIFGSSVAEVGFDATLLSKKMNKSVYNLSIDGTTIMRSKFMIDEFLSYSKICDTVLIGLVYNSFSEIKELTEPSRFLAHKSNSFIKGHIEKVSPELYYKLYSFPFYSFIATDHTYYKNAFIGLRNKLKGSCLILDKNNGSLSHNVKYEDTRSFDAPYQDVHISENSRADFIRLINEFKQRSITPILIILPMHKNGQSSFRNYDDFTRTAKEITNETNTLLLDFTNHKMANDKNYFYNNAHLNSLGNSYFSLSLIDSLYNKTRKHNKELR